MYPHSSPRALSYQDGMARGMTLVETVVYVSLFALIMLAIAQSVLYMYRTNSYAIQQASAVASAQHGVDVMVREIREAAYASDGSYPIVTLGPNTLTLYADIDGDPLVERIRYYVQGSSIMRGVVDPTGDPPSYGGAEVVSTLSDAVRNTDHGIPLFMFYDKNGALMTDYTRVADVRFVTVSVQVDIDPNRSPTPLLLRSSAALRNVP